MHKFLTATAAATLALSPTVPVSATPASGMSAVSFSTSRFADIDVKADKFDKWDLTLRSKGATDVRVQRLVFAPGGQSGWHSHPGPNLITVTAGSVIVTDGGDPLCTDHSYGVGDTFIDHGGSHAHRVRNASASSAAEMAVISLFPAGATGRIDAPKPNNCPN